jgi:hypothetical protein
MKAIVLITCLWMGFGAQAARVEQDSILLKIDKRNQTLIGAKADKSKSLKEELTQVFEKKGLVLTDSLWQQIRNVIRTNSEGDSSLSVQIGNSRVKIGIIKSDTYYDTPQKTFKMTNPNEKKENAFVFHGDGKEEVQIGLSGIHVKDGKEEVHVDWNGIRVKEGNGEETKVIWGKDSTRVKKKENVNFYSRDGFNLYLGLNSLTGQLPEVTTMIYPPVYLQTDTELKPLGSRYVSLEISESAMLARGKKAALKLGYGIGFDWYNFMFDHSRVVQKATAGSIFQPLLDATGKEMSLSKNKLVVSYLTLPIMPHVVFSKNSAIESVGLGGYVSYRIDSWTKATDAKTDQIKRESSNFNLNSFRYGLRAEFSFKNFPDLFFNYDLVPLFKMNASPELTGFSFGIRI